MLRVASLGICFLMNFHAISDFKSSITFVEDDIVEEDNLHQTKKSISANLSKAPLVEPV